MRLFISLLLMPVGLGLLLTLLLPDSVNLFAGLLAVAAYYAVVIIRASDLTGS